ncbi:DUF5808 domain-containing protein [Phyllobacterium zundukense]|uniref:DUF5808 domain-containing protein n=1 Tax=Phyllobacterium zundukense TaxID=1867719 RepID=UPI003AAD644A
MSSEDNKSSWSNSENWSHGIGRIYFSRSDSRLWVPKRNPAMGCTINMAHRRAIWWLLLLILVPTLISMTVLAL